nr:Mfa1 family fimbria major subunit [Bacteroides acidifaciens]
MKTKSFIISMGVAALLFASCSNDDNLVSSTGGNSTEPAVVEGEPTYVSFSIKSGEAKDTRASEAPSAGDDQINGNVILLIFNAQSKVLEEKFTIASTAVTNQTFLITSGNKRIFAFANLTANSGLTAVDALEPKVATVDAMLELMASTGTGLGQTNTSVPMSTVDDGQSVVVNNGIEQGNAAADNHIDLVLYRMLSRAKLVLGTGVTADKFVASGFTANNIAKATYLVQHAVGGVVKSPLYEKTWGTSITTADFMDEETFAGTPNTLNKLYYLTENTSPSFLKGAATHFILKGTFIPGRIIIGGTFNVATQSLVNDYKNNPTVADCTEYCYITESPRADVVPVGEYYLNATILNDAIDAYNAGMTDVTKHVNHADVKYKEYKSGSYYRINLGKGDAGNTVFGVERNKSYTVTVNTVTGPGFNKPDGDDGAEGKPTDPIDQKTYLDVSITVKGWDEVGQGADIN